MNKIKIAPSILSGDFAKMGETVADTNKWGADYVHVDVMDGTYVPNITFGMPMVKAIKKYSEIPLDVHLMIINPEKYVEQFADEGADIISFHPDATGNVNNVINLIKNKGKKVGLVLNPDKSVDLVMPYLHLIDMIIIMGVYPGFGGQKFIKDVVEKITILSEIIKRNHYSIDLELDGGVTEENAAEIVAKGINILVGGSSVFNSENPAETIKKLKGEIL